MSDDLTDMDLSVYMDSESDFEDRLVETLTENGWIHETNPIRNTEDILLEQDFKEAARNHTTENIPEEEIEQLYQETEQLLQTHPDTDPQQVLDKKQAFIHGLFQKNSSLTVEDENGETVRAQLINFENPDLNVCKVMQQVTYSHPGVQNRIIPDIVLYIAGIPVAVLELKSTAKSGDHAKNAMSDLRSYEDQSPGLFIPSLFGVGVAEETVRDPDTGSYIQPVYYRGYGVPERFESPWYDDSEEDHYTSGVEAVSSLCSVGTVLLMYRFGQLFEDGKNGWSHIVARHQQYFVSSRIETDVRQKLKEYGTQEVKFDGVEHSSFELVVHTQGSGKTLAMIFAAQRLRNRVSKPWDESPVRMLIVVDREELDSATTKQLEQIEGVGLSNAQAQAATDLKHLIQDTQNDLIVTTIQKIGELADETGSVEQLTDDVFISFEDEAHRELLKQQGSVYDKAVPNKIRYGFTGTPTDEIVSYMDGSGFFHEYSLDQSLVENVTVPVETVDMTPRLDGLDSVELDDEFEGNLETEQVSREDAMEMLQRAGSSKFEEFWTDCRRVVTDAVITDFDQNYLGTRFNGLLVCESRDLAAKHGRMLQDHFGEDVVQVLYSTGSSDSQFLRDSVQYSKDKIIKKFKNDDDPLQLVVVCNMLLTGFDAPNLKCMYLNKDISQEHTLLQAIARVNRPAEGKEFGRILDFKGCTDGLEVQLQEQEFQDVSIDIDDVFEKFRDALYDCLSYFGCSTGGEFVEKLESNDRFLAESVRGREDQFVELFSDVRSLREKALPDKRVLEYQALYSMLQRAYNYAEPNRDSSSTGLATAVGRSGGKALQQVVDVQGVRADQKFEISESVFEDVDTSIDIQRQLEEVQRKAKRHEKVYGDKSFSERTTELYSDWVDGDVTEEEIERVEKEIDRKSQQMTPVGAKQIESVLDSEFGEVDAEIVTEVYEEFEQLPKIGGVKDNVVTELYEDDSFPLDDYGLIYDCLDAYESSTDGDK